MISPVVEVAQAKINLALQIVGRRADGYHELDSVVAFAQLGDVLTFAVAETPGLTVTGPFAADVPQGNDNIVHRARDLITALYQLHGVALPPLHITLEKNLPVASGLGGGSADAAAVVRGIMRMAAVDLPKAALHRLALQLGADVPVCLKPTASRMQGIGEELTPLAKPVRTAVTLVNPRIPLQTKDVFAKLGFAMNSRRDSTLNPDDATTWQNDLAAPAMALVPQIAHAIEALELQQVFHTVRMSGSGATCFGLTDDVKDAETACIHIAHANPGWWVAASTLS